ncbi:MAG: dicarboxylate/amino acid:cation symporter [Patescibacteria group bacterium]
MFNPLKYFAPHSLKHLNEHISALVEGRLWLKILIGMFLGIAVGLIFSSEFGLLAGENAETLGSWLALPGHIFLTLIQMIVIPLILASIIRGIAASENFEQLKKMGVGLVLYFLFTTIIAVSIGVGITQFIKPGQYVDTSAFTQEFSEVKVNQEEIEQKQIKLNELPGKVVATLPDNPLNNMVNMEMLQVVIFSIIIGLALVSIKPERSKPILNLLNSVQAVCMKIVRWTMLLAPIAVFGLLAQLTMKTGIQSLFSIGYYMGTVVTGLFIMILVYLFIVMVIGGRNPLRFLSNIREAQLLAFSTDSSIVTMPLSTKIAEEKLKVRSSVSNFVIPIGATINMDGTALYQGVATIFLAQIFGIELGIGAILVLIMTAVGASIGTPATPGVGIIILSTVLVSIGIPTAGIVLIVGVDRILEMMRTATNVTGDLTAAVVMEKIVKKEAPVKTHLREALSQ